MSKINSNSYSLYYKVRLLSELTGVEHELLYEDRLYSLDCGGNCQWKRERISYQQMLGYVEGMINGVLHLSNDIRNLPDRDLSLLAENNLCKKLNITGEIEFIATGVGSYNEWNTMIEVEKKMILSKSYGKKNNK